MDTKIAMDAKADAHRIGIIAQSEATWTLFVGSGQADQAEGAVLRRAEKDLERKLSVEKGAKRSQEHRLQGAERIRGYLAGAEQSGMPG